jgi:hypothetical protein
MRKAGGEDLDSWEYLQYRVKHHNTRERIQSALAAAKDDKKSSREEIILRRLEKGRKLDEKPSSLATSLSHRAAFTDEAEENKENLKDKKKTVAIACKAREMDIAGIAECRRLKALSRRDEKEGSPAKKQKGLKENRIALKTISNTLDRSNWKSEGTFSNNDPMPVMEDEEGIQVGDDTIIELLESEDEDPMPQQGGGVVRGLMNLVTLSTDDLRTLDNNKLVNDACIDDMGDIIQSSIDKSEISICHTGFWAAVRENGWGEEAKKFIHPDPEDAKEERWQAYRFTRGQLKSKLLLIPCNFPGDSEVEDGHWILALREKGDNGKHKLHILDSLGKDSGTAYRNTIARKLGKTPIFPNFPKGKSFDVEKQVECECGARVAKYMEDLTHNYRIMGEKDSITQMIGRSVQWERIQGKQEVMNCRNQIKDRLEGEKRNRGIVR